MSSANIYLILTRFGRFYPKIGPDFADAIGFFDVLSLSGGFTRCRHLRPSSGRVASFNVR